MALQASIFSYLRFALSGDIAGACVKFGRLSAKMAHQGTLLSIETIENAATAMAYDKAVRGKIAAQSRRRIADGRRLK